MAEGPKNKTPKKPEQSASQPADASAPGKQVAAQPGAQKLHSPLGPLLWLLIPFVGVIVYAYLSGE